MISYLVVEQGGNLSINTILSFVETRSNLGGRQNDEWLLTDSYQNGFLIHSLIGLKRGIQRVGPEEVILTYQFLSF